MEQVISENLRGFTIKFKTKSGVFSKQGLDVGTKLLIDNLEVIDRTLIADLGSGTGAIGFVCAKLDPYGHVHLLDDHLRSVELAKENTELNDLRNVEVYLSDLFSVFPNRTYHQILSNPPQQLGNEFLEELITESYKHLKENGSLWLVVKNNLKTVIERILNKIFTSYQVVANSKTHIVIKASRTSR